MMEGLKMTNEKDFIIVNSFNEHEVHQKYKLFYMEDFFKEYSRSLSFKRDIDFDSYIKILTTELINESIYSSMEELTNRVIYLRKTESVFNKFLEHYGIQNEILKLNESNSIRYNEYLISDWLSNGELHTSITDALNNNIRNKKSMLTVDFSRSNSRKFYNFVDIPNFYNELSKLNFYDQASLLKFVNRYGLPLSTPDTIYQNKKINVETNVVFEIHLKLSKFKIDYSNFLRILLDVNNREKLINGPEDIEMYSQQNLILDFDKKSNQFSFKMPIYSLLDLAYFQMGKALVNNVVLNKCLHCHNYFEKTHHRQEFCPPHPGLTRSSCKTAYHREEKKRGEL